ncbi:MAG TPA: hypothetical protein VGL51_17875 [Solirubrobacteraceae bacterium]|jgi:hypothetical protein
MTVVVAGSQALTSARDGVHVALRSGGHCFAGRSSTTGIVIDATYDPENVIRFDQSVQ